MAKLKRNIHPMQIAPAIAQGKTGGNLNLFAENPD
jgi:hypothetical protein